jgi:hypothetical protein
MDANQENSTRNTSKKNTSRVRSPRLTAMRLPEAKVPLVQKVCAMAASEVITPRKKQRGDDQGRQSYFKKCYGPR